MSLEDSLTELRRQIREIDSGILDLIGRRQELARGIGEHKVAQNLPIKDEKVEAAVLASVRERARQSGIYEDLAEKVFQHLIDYSCKTQEELRLGQKRLTLKAKRILIAGGMGGMGQWFAHYFASRGHTVRICDTNPEQNEFPRVATLTSALSDSDIVILATPVSATSTCIEEIIKAGTKALVFDCCSIKAPLLKAIEKAQKAGIRVASLHPMFGPQVRSLAGRNILLCESGQKALTDEMAELFKTSAATLKVLPLQKHDEYMAYVLGLSHLTNLVFAGTLSKSDFTFAELNSTASTTFGGQAQVTKLVVGENPDLYYEIQAENAFNPTVLKSFKDTTEEFIEAIQKKDRGSFKALMKKCRDFFQLPPK